LTYHSFGNFAFTEGSTVGASGSSMATVVGHNMSAIQPIEDDGDRARDQRASLMSTRGSRAPMNLDIMSTSAPVTVSRNTGLITSTPATTSTERASMNMNITGAAQNIASKGTFPSVSQGALNTYLRQKAQLDAEKAAEAKKAAVLSAGNTLTIGPGFTYTRTAPTTGLTLNRVPPAETPPEVDPGSLTSTAPPCRPWPSCGQGQPALVEEEPFYKHPAVIGGGIILLLAAGYAIYKSQGG
jgi:hypothetical protein